MFEGSRAFDIVWGAVTGSACFALGIATLWTWLGARSDGRPSLFGTAIDPQRRLQFAWGMFAMGMGGTNVGCRLLSHRYLAGVHEGFFALTVLLVALVLPCLVRRYVVTRTTAGA